MKITQMQYFVAACEWKSITKAANAQHISQPAMTIAIRELELELGTELLYRSKRAVVPTAEGEIFLRRCREILDSIDHLSDEFLQISQSHNTIRLGLPPMIGSFCFPALFSTFHRLHPEISLSLQEVGSIDAGDLIREGKLDLAIVAVGAAQEPLLESHVLFQTQIVYCVGPHHRLAKRTTLHFSEIGNDPLILFSGGFYHVKLVNEAFRREKMTPGVLLHSNQLLTIKNMVENTTVGAFLMPQVILPTDRITALPFAEPLVMNVAAVWRKGATVSRDMKTLIRFIEQKFCPPDAANGK